MGAVIYTSMADWQGWTWDPEGSVDLESEPGTVLLAAGQRQARGRVRGQHPDYAEGGWSYWFLHGCQPVGKRIYGRIRVAATEEGLDSAEWSPYMGGWQYLVDPESGEPDSTGRGLAAYDIGTEILNLGLADEGPWYELEVTLRE